LNNNLSGDKIQEAQNFYASFLKFTQAVFSDISVLNINSIAKEIMALRSEIQNNRRFLLYARNFIEPVNDENYLASHAVRTTVIAMIIGKHLNIPPFRLLELGMAAFLHDIGMLNLPPQTYLNKLELKDPEKKLIFSHPIHSYNLLKSFNCPPSVSIAALEHHERENGCGYPRKLTGEKISLFGKIIAVACSYEALSAKRSYKKMKDQHSGMVELLKNEGNQYDITIVKALVSALSIYPIGTFVLLSNGKRGRVFNINPENQHYPVVQVEESIVRTSDHGIRITSPLTCEEIDYKDNFGAA